MPGEVRANLGHLDASALQADDQATEMASGHTAAHGEIESAQAGWAGRSAMSLAKRLAQWQAADAALRARVVEHAESLQCAAKEYGAADQCSAEQIEQAQSQIDQLAAQQNL